MPHYRKLYLKTVESLDVNDMPDDFCRLMWVLLPLALCQEGRGMDSAAWIKSRLFPLRLDVTLPMIEVALDWLAARGMIRRYQVHGRPYFCVPTWHRYQGDTSRESKTHYPPPPDEACSEEGKACPEATEARSEPAADSFPPTGRQPGADLERGQEGASARSGAAHESVESQSEHGSQSCSRTDASAAADASTDATADAASGTASDAGAEERPKGIGAGAPPVAPPPPGTRERERRRGASARAQRPPDGQPERSPCAAQTQVCFQDWLDRIQESGNRPLVLREMFVTLYPERDPPPLSKLGAFAVKVGGASRLAELMWRCSARPPTGDILAYLYGVHRHDSPSMAYCDQRDLRDLESLIHQ